MKIIISRIWKKVNRYVKRGSKGIAVFPSQALEPYVYHVFDISDTGGRLQNLTWYFMDENVKDYAQIKDKIVNDATEEKKFDSTKKCDNQKQQAQQGEIEPSR